MVNDKTSNATAVTGYDITKNSDQRVTLDNNNLRTFDAQSKVVLDTIATNTQSIHVNTDTLEAKVDTTNTKLDTLIDHNDGVETILTALDTAQDLTNSTLSDTNGKIDAMRASDTLTTVKNTVALVTQNLTDGSAKAKVMGADASNGQFQLRTDGDGHLQVDCLTSGLPSGGATSAKQDTQITHLSEIEGAVETLEGCVGSNKVNVNISSNAVDFATESTLQTIAEFNCDTTDVTIAGSALPSGASTSALQGTANTALAEIEGAVETLEGCVGSNKINVNISSGGFGGAVTNAGTFVTQNTTQNPFNGAVTNAGTFVTQNTTQNPFNGAVTNAGLTALNNSIGSNKVNVNISSGGFDGAVTNGALTELASALNSDRLDVNIANGGFSGAVTNAGLTALNNSIGSNKVNVNISSGGFDGAVTNGGTFVTQNTTQNPFNGAVTNAGTFVTQNTTQNPFNGAVTNAGTFVTQNTSQNPFDGAVTNAHLTELGTAINSAKMDVNISSGNISGFATSAKQDTQETSLNAIEVEVKYGQTCEDKEVIDDDTISSENLSIVIDTESYAKVRLYGNTTASPASLGGSDFLTFGSNASSGTYYQLHDGTFSAMTATVGGSAVHYVSVTLENPPRYIKVYNKHGSNSYTITKLRMVGNNKMINV